MTSPTDPTLGKIADLAHQIADLAAGASTPPPTTPPTTTPPAAGDVTVTATVAGAATVTVAWSTTRSDVTSWTVGRDGRDVFGPDAWSTELAADARSQTFSSLVAGDAYTFTLVPHTAAGDAAAVSAKATVPTGESSGGSTPPPSGGPSSGSGSHGSGHGGSGHGNGNSNAGGNGDSTGGGGTTTPPTGSTGDGVQAAVTQNWGAITGGDEFDKPGTPDPKLWSMYDGPGHDGNGIRTPSAFSVANSILTNHGDANGNTGGMAWQGGSSKTFRVEARMRLYNVGTGSGSQYHPVLIMWPDSDEWPQGGEDDYAETDIGSGQMEVFIHWPGNDGSAQSSASKKLDITQWHNYAVERSAAAVTGWIDGEQWFRFTGQVLPIPGPMHATIQLDCFDSKAKMQPANQDVDWIRFYAPPK